VTATFTMVSDSGDLAHSQQRERDSRRRRIAIWEKRRSGWRGNGSKEGSGRGVSGFILPRGRGLGWSFVGRDWVSRACNTPLFVNLIRPKFGTFILG
jgi:hypothetical protein